MKAVDFKTINTFESMTKYKTFSRYDKNLAKTFKDNSLKTLVHNLKHQRKFIRPKFLEEFNQKYPIENQELTKTDLERKARKFSKLLAEKKKKIIITISPWSKSIHGIKFFEQGPDPSRYSPNYKSVFKNAPSHKFAPLKIKNNNNNKNDDLEKLSQTTQNKLFNLFNKMKSKKTNNNNLPSKTLPSISTINLINKRNNHAYKFGNYTPRKELTINCSSIVSYIEPHNYKNDKNERKTIDFKRMVDRTKSILINEASLEMPPSYYYNPKYNYVDQKPKQILFTHKKIIDENKKSNKFLIHKLWTSYNVTKYYQLVDNDKLKKDICLDIN